MKCQEPLRSNGFTLIEALLALLVFSLSLSLFIQILHVSSTLVSDRPDGQKPFFLLQLRSYLAQCSSVWLEEDQLFAVYDHETFVIEQDGDRLVKRGGYEILLEGIETLAFYEEDERIFIEVDGYQAQIH